MSKFLPLALLTTILSGCAIFPQTETALITNGNKSEPMCFSENKNLVETRIKGYLAQCFKPDFVFVSGTTGYNLNYRVMETKNSGTTTYNVYSPSGSSQGYFLNVKIDQNNKNCATSVNVVAFNMFWEDNFKKIKDSVNGLEVNCPM
ncbi:hypothetical protein H4J58_00170 [Colwellia sp. MB3u-70]|uniref:hypothetical protein n=1 Tax=unclassified Colwellia TaxID=196834 RepID=UPI0015F5E583|nr:MULTISPECIES: hypothetical protein [unclassified Colwellia]MBA6291521.1 hypothetical protein [Colwellia sp. MB3u-8]MBA6305563.1 hypothetical protein [Colwellia sp. MB3u-70]